MEQKLHRWRGDYYVVDIGHFDCGLVFNGKLIARTVSEDTVWAYNEYHKPMIEAFADYYDIETIEWHD